MTKEKVHRALEGLERTACGRTLHFWLGGTFFRNGEVTVEVVPEAIEFEGEVTCRLCLAKSSAKHALARNDEGE